MLLKVSAASQTCNTLGKRGKPLRATLLECENARSGFSGVSSDAQRGTMGRRQCEEISEPLQMATMREMASLKGTRGGGVRPDSPADVTL